MEKLKDSLNYQKINEYFIKKDDFELMAQNMGECFYTYYKSLSIDVFKNMFRSLCEFEYNEGQILKFIVKEIQFNNKISFKELYVGVLSTFFNKEVDYECIKCSNNFKSKTIKYICPECSSKKLIINNQQELLTQLNFFMSMFDIYVLEESEDTKFLIYNNQKQFYHIKQGFQSLRDYIYLNLKNLNKDFVDNNLILTQIYNSQSLDLCILKHLKDNTNIINIQEEGFKPTNEKLFINEGKTYFNTFNPNKYLLLDKINPKDFKDFELKTACPNIYELLNNLTGQREEGLNYLIKYLSFCLCNPTQRTEKVISFFGDEATGKGIFYEYILNPLFSNNYCVNISQNEFDSDFNDFLSKKLFIFIDESYYNPKIEQDLLRLTTTKTTTINRKHGTKKEENIYFNIICASNKSLPMKVGSRRGVYFRSKTLGGSLSQAPKIGSQLVEEIPKELDLFACYLKSLDVSFEFINLGYESDEKKDIMNMTMTTEDQFIKEMLNYESFEDFISNYTFLTSKSHRKTINNIEYIETDYLFTIYNEFLSFKGYKKIKSNKFYWIYNKLNVDRSDKTQHTRGLNDKKKNMFWIAFNIIQNLFDESNKKNEVEAQ